MHHGTETINSEYKLKPNEFDYGPLGKVPKFKGTHPAIMADFIAKMDWKEKLNLTRKGTLNRDKMKHESAKYRLITFFENLINGGKDFAGYSNWNLLKRKKSLIR